MYTIIVSKVYTALSGSRRAWNWAINQDQTATMLEGE